MGSQPGGAHLHWESQTRPGPHPCWVPGGSQSSPGSTVPLPQGSVVVVVAVTTVVVVVGHAPRCGLHVRVSSSTSTFGGWSGETHRTRILRWPGFLPCFLVLTCTPTKALHA